MALHAATDDPTTERRRAAGWPSLVVSLAAVVAVAVLGGMWTDTGPGSWYAGLEQPAWDPPDWLFGPVWSVLYLLMAVSAWLVARQGLRRGDVRLALALYAVQLALNLAWTGVFFALESPVGAQVVIVALAVAIIATLGAFWQVHRVAALLLVPYLLWVLYAAVLNAAIATLN